VHVTTAAKLLDEQFPTEVRFDGDTAIVQMAELFQRDRSVILRHIGNVFEEGELERGATCAR
jgi:hypothetical protein